MHRIFGNKAKLAMAGAVSIALGGSLSSSLLSASAQSAPSPTSPYAYTGLFKGGVELQASDIALLAKAQSENPNYGLQLRPATQLPTAVEGVDAFAVRSAKGPACLVLRLTTSADAPVGGGYGVACPSEGSSTIDFMSADGSFGIAPDGVTTVSYTFAGQKTQTVNVTDNLWQAPPDATGVSFAENGTVRTLPLMPASTLPNEVKSYGGGLIAGGKLSATQAP